MAELACLLALLLPFLAACQTSESYTYGNRPIDKLPKSSFARPEEERGWGEPTLEGGGVLLDLKDHYRIGAQGIQRLCVIEAWASGPGTRRLELVGAPEGVLWEARAEWVGANRRMRPYWLPLGAGGPQRLELLRDGAVVLSTDCTLASGAPEALTGAATEEAAHETDADLALLGGTDQVLARGETLSVRVAVRPEHVGAEVIAALQYPGRPSRALARRTVVGVCTLRLGTAGWLEPRCELSVRTVKGPLLLAEERFPVHLLDAPPAVAFGARYADLRYTLSITDGDAQRSWDELWQGSGKRDVVVSFPPSDARFVFWRGASYVGCWALPEAWLTYEWLEAEPYFYGAVDCVEPIMDKDCRYSRAEIVESNPARAVVKWSYALTDFEQKIIRDERAEETFTLYPDGIGTRFLRGFYRSGWHENQEFIVINRPGRRPSDALSPQAITFLSPSGERQDPVWPKPGFSVDGWPQVVSIVHLGDGPHPFMVTLDAPTQVKVWADPYLDKPDLFNCYPHWPVTRGMFTSWLTDPADFERPTHCNLANLVNRPLRETAEEKDFLWLIGVCASEQQALDAARCWLKPGRIEPLEGLASAEYSQTERAYLLRPAEGARTLRFTLVAEDDVPIVNPAFVIEGWTGPMAAVIPGAKRLQTNHGPGAAVIWAQGRIAEPSACQVQAASP